MSNKLKIHYTYKTTNLINNKVYFGKHSQPFGKIDNYFGSGTAILNAIKKYGRQNFIKEIIEFFETSEDAYDAEKILIDKAIVESIDTYNLYLGGKGAPSGKDHPMYNKVSVINNLGEIEVIDKEYYYNNKHLYKTTQSGMISVYDLNENKLFIQKSEYNKDIHKSINCGRKLSDEAKRKVSIAAKEKNNLKGNVCVKDKNNGGFKFISKEEFETGDYESSHKGKIISEESKEKFRNTLKEKNKNKPKRIPKKYVKVIDENGNIFKIDTLNEKYLSGEFKKYKSEINRLPKSQEMKNKVSKSLKGRKLTQSHKDKIGACANSSKKVSIYGIIYKSVKSAMESVCKLYNISKKELSRRLLSDDYLDYFYVKKA